MRSKVRVREWVRVRVRVRVGDVSFLTTFFFAQDVTNLTCVWIAGKCVLYQEVEYLPNVFSRSLFFWRTIIHVSLVCTSMSGYATLVCTVSSCDPTYSSAKGALPTPPYHSQRRPLRKQCTLMGKFDLKRLRLGFGNQG